MANRRLIVGVSGASGAPVTIELLQQLQTEKDLEVHLICSKWGLATLEHEAGVTRQDLEGLCTRPMMRRIGAQPRPAVAFQRWAWRWYPAA